MDSDGNAAASRHLESREVAEFIDRALAPSERARVEAHLADCDACRAEVVAVARTVRGANTRRWQVPVTAAAAVAALLLMWARAAEKPAYREHVVTTTVAPMAVAPRGASASADSLLWTRVPGADRYHLAVFDSVGHVLWESQTADTIGVLPSTVPLTAGARYFWKVEARTAWNRWVTSELTEFSVHGGRR